MSQVTKISRNNTKVARFAGRTVITLHDTDIVDVNSETITLNTGGWPTTTTRTRMTQASHELGLGYGVSFAKGTCSVSFMGNVAEFNRTVTLNRLTGEIVSDK